MRLSGRVVAITGASAGIGRATAELCAKEGAAIAVSARRAGRLSEIVSAVSARGGRALAVPGDVTSDADMRAFVSRAVETFGTLDVMICNAGIGFHGTLAETTPEIARRLVDVNVLGTIYAAHAAHAVFVRQGHGHLIAVSSVAGRRGVGGMSLYSATKFAQVGFIEGLRTEFLGTKIRASIVYPISTPTEFHGSMIRDFGHAVEGDGPRQTVGEVAAAIVDCIVSPRAEVYLYRKAWWLAVLSVLAPARADRLMQKYARGRAYADSTS
ncbi:MAG TPA: SDR family NAD(P)-dependent oxidoreductase [Vicinamibacterales bacterium]|jgi:NADP-dependent 3-hydroxy acid dehydrogenase YdfG